MPSKHNPTIEELERELEIITTQHNEVKAKIQGIISDRIKKLGPYYTQKKLLLSQISSLRIRINRKHQYVLKKRYKQLLEQGQTLESIFEGKEPLGINDITQLLFLSSSGKELSCHGITFRYFNLTSAQQQRINIIYKKYNINPPRNEYRVNEDIQLIRELIREDFQPHHWTHDLVFNESGLYYGRSSSAHDTNSVVYEEPSDL